LRRALRRRLSADDLRRLSAQAETLLQKVRAACVDHEESEETTGSAAQTERHHQNSKPDSQDSEPCHDQARGDPIRKEPNPAARAGQGATIPLPLVVKACPSLATYWPGQIRDWPDLVRAAEALHGWLGISPDAWRQAEQAMGSATAAIAVACLLERAGDIRSPGGYLRRLTEQAEAGAFSPGPMVMALLTRPDRVAA
jgi:replication initiation protein RepC